MVNNLTYSFHAHIRAQQAPRATLERSSAQTSGPRERLDVSESRMIFDRNLLGACCARKLTGILMSPLTEAQHALEAQRGARAAGPAVPSALAAPPQVSPRR